MDTNTATQTTASYQSQNQGTEDGTVAFHDALERVAAVGSLSVLASAWPLHLMDYLAERVERHSLASRVAMMDLMRDAISQDALQSLAVTMKATETEAARAFLVAADIRPGAIAPVDYPTVTRAYIAARSAAGCTFSVRHDG